MAQVHAHPPTINNMPAPPHYANQPPQHNQMPNMQRPWQEQAPLKSAATPVVQFQNLKLDGNAATGAKNDQYGTMASGQSSLSSGTTCVVGLPTIYEAWTMKKVLQTQDGSRPSWCCAVKTPLHLTHDQLVKLIQDQKANGSVQKQYDSLLSPHQQEQIQALLSAKRAEERDPSVAWELAAVKDVRGALEKKKNATETKKLQVVLKRHDIVAKPSKDKDKKAASLTRDRLDRLNMSQPSGEVVDLRHHHNPTPPQSQPKSQPVWNDQFLDPATKFKPPPIQMPHSNTHMPPQQMHNQHPPGPEKGSHPQKGFAPAQPFPQPPPPPPPPQVQVNTYQPPAPPSNGHAPPPMSGPPPHDNKKSSMQPPWPGPPPARTPVSPVKAREPPPVIVDDRRRPRGSHSPYEDFDDDDDDGDDYDDDEYFYCDSAPSTPPSLGSNPCHDKTGKYRLSGNSGARPSQGGRSEQRRFSGLPFDEIREIIPNRSGSYRLGPQYEVRPAYNNRSKGSPLMQRSPTNASQRERDEGYGASDADVRRSRRRRERRDEDDFEVGYDEGGYMHVQQAARGSHGRQDGAYNSGRRHY